MIYLDADIQVYENIDYLFDLPDGHFYAVMDCFCEKTWSHTKQYQIGYCQQCPNKVEWPESMGPRPALYFNAGMFVSEPSLTTCEKLLSTVRITTPTPFAEQDFLNMFFKDIYKPIPLIYNLVLAMLWRHPENVELHKVKVVHYCAAVSPQSQPIFEKNHSFIIFGWVFLIFHLGFRVLSPGGILGKKQTWIERTLRC